MTRAVNARSACPQPYADFNCLKLPAGAMDKILDLATLSDIFPTGACVPFRG